jgi:hypothetical protein
VIWSRFGVSLLIKSLFILNLTQDQESRPHHFTSARPCLATALRSTAISLSLVIPSVQRLRRCASQRLHAATAPLWLLPWMTPHQHLHSPRLALWCSSYNDDATSLCEATIGQRWLQLGDIDTRTCLLVRCFFVGLFGGLLWPYIFELKYRALFWSDLCLLSLRHWISIVCI